MNKKNNSKNIQYINKCMLSQEQMIEIQEEAYYRALKRIEQEHVLNKELKGKREKKKFKRSERVLLVLNALFFPWKINKSFFIDNQIYDSIKKRLENTQTLDEDNQVIDINGTLEYLKNGSYGINKALSVSKNGKLTINFIVKSNKINYNDSVEIN